MPEDEIGNKEKFNYLCIKTMKGLDTVESLSVEVKGSKVSLKYF